MADGEYQESPNSRLERYLIIALSIGILLTGDQLVARIWSEPDRPQTGAWIGLALLLGAAIYLALLFNSLIRLRYTLAEGRLVVRQGWRRVVIDLEQPVQLHRWRYRWAWSGGAALDLGVVEIDLVPPLGLFRQGGIWVVAGQTPEGVHRAVALRPSPRLLSLLKEWAAVHRRAN